MPESLASSIAFQEERHSKVPVENTGVNDQSIISISLHEEPVKEEPAHENTSLGHESGAVFNSSPHAHTQSHDDIQFEEVNDGASNSAQSLSYQVEGHNQASRPQSRENSEPRKSAPEGVNEEASADQRALYPPPRRLSQRAAKAAQEARLHAGPPLTPRSRSPQHQVTKQRQGSEDSALVPVSENALVPEPTPAKVVPIPMAAVKPAGNHGVVVTEHTRYFPGSKWTSVVDTSLEELERTVANETAAAIGVELQCVRVTVEAAVTGMSCGLSVSHAPTMTTGDIDERLSSCPYEATLALLESICTPHSLGSANEHQVEREPEELPDPVAPVPADADKEMKAKKRAAETPGKKGTKISKARSERKRVSPGSPKADACLEESTPSDLLTPQPSAARSRLERAFGQLPVVLVTPRIYHLRSPRPGVLQVMDRESSLYIEDLKRRNVVLNSQNSASTTTPQRGKNGSRSSSVPIPQSGADGHPPNPPPQHMQRGVPSLALRQRPIIQVQQQTCAMAAPSDDPRGHRPINGVEHTANTRSVSHRTRSRSRSRSPQQLVIAPEADALSDAEPEDVVPTVSMDVSSSVAEQDDYALMTEGVEGAVAEEENDSELAHFENGEESTDTKEEPLHHYECDTDAAAVEEIMALDEDIHNAAVAANGSEDPVELPSPHNAHPGEIEEVKLQYPSGEHSDEQDPIPDAAPNPFV